MKHHLAECPCLFESCPALQYDRRDCCTLAFVANAKNTRLFFANFTVYFPLVTVFTDHVPILLIEVVSNIIPCGFSFITDVQHTLNPRQ